MNIAAILEEYEAQIPFYAELARVVEERVIDSLKGCRSPFETTRRFKKPESLAKKLILKGYNQLDDVSDRAGVRLILLHREDMPDALSRIRSQFGTDIVEYEDKSSGLQSDRFGYRGVHIQARLDTHRLSPDAPPMECEIQVRSSAEYLWSVVFHRTFYKSEVRIPDLSERRLHRLGALVELFDEQCSLARKEVGEVDGSQHLSLVNHVRAVYEDMNEAMVEQDLLSLVVPALFVDASLEEIKSKLIPEFDEFIRGNADKIITIWSNNESSSRENPFFRDGSSLLVWFLLTRDRYSLRRMWSEAIDTAFLYHLATVWGTPYADQ